MIVPLAMKLREQGLPVKLVYLGHRDGSTLIVRKDFPGKDLESLAGKRIAIPSRYSNQHLVLRKLMKDRGLPKEAFTFIELPPPEMPAALAGGAVDAYFVGEPHPARAELDGTGRVLHHAKDIWPEFISCGLVVHENLIAERPEVVAELVESIARSGAWIDGNRLDAAKIAAPYFRQKEELLRYVLTQPPDRVKYTSLTPRHHELEAIRAMGVETGILDGKFTVAELLDTRFVPDEIRPTEIQVQERSTP